MGMNSLIWLCLSWSMVAQAAPLARAGVLEIRENENIHITTGEPARDRTMFAMVSMLCLAVLSFLLGMFRTSRQHTVLMHAQGPGIND